MNCISKTHFLYLTFKDLLPDKVKKRIITLEVKFYYIIKKQPKMNGFFFIQIGSNDGRFGDPIRKNIKKYNWSGILIEPIKYIVSFDAFLLFSKS